MSAASAQSLQNWRQCLDSSRQDKEHETLICVPVANMGDGQFKRTSRTVLIGVRRVRRGTTEQVSTGSYIENEARVVRTSAGWDRTGNSKAGVTVPGRAAGPGLAASVFRPRLPAGVTPAPSSPETRPEETERSVRWKQINACPMQMTREDIEMTEWCDR